MSHDLQFSRFPNSYESIIGFSGCFVEIRKGLLPVFVYLLAGGDFWVFTDEVNSILVCCMAGSSFTIILLIFWGFTGIYR